MHHGVAAVRGLPFQRGARGAEVVLRLLVGDRGLIRGLCKVRQKAVLLVFALQKGWSQRPGPGDPYAPTEQEIALAVTCLLGSHPRGHPASPSTRAPTTRQRWACSACPACG